MAEWVVLVLSGFAVTPLLVLLHEAGHALPALWFGEGPVAITVGCAKPALAVRVGRLSLSISPLGTRGECRSQTQTLAGPRAVAWVLGGPAASAVGAVAAALAAGQSEATGRAVLSATAIVAAGQAVTSLVPRWAATPGGKPGPTDGLQAWSMLRGVALSQAPKRAGGLKDPVDASYVVDVLVVIGSMALLFSHAVPATTLRVLLGMTPQAVIDLVHPAASQGAPAPPPRTPMKTCPACGAEVHAAAWLCYCYHELLPSPAPARDSAEPARRR
jgi:hypothetical protein